MSDRFDTRGWLVRWLVGHKQPEVMELPGDTISREWRFVDEYGTGYTVTGERLSKVLERAEKLVRREVH